MSPDEIEGAHISYLKFRIVYLMNGCILYDSPVTFERRILMVLIIETPSDWSDVD
jgi:hypothetical protein